RYNDDGVTALYQHIRHLLGQPAGVLPAVTVKTSTGLATVVPPSRVRYLADIASAVRGYHARSVELSDAARRRQHLLTAREVLGSDALDAHIDAATAAIDARTLAALSGWPTLVERYSGDRFAFTVRDKTVETPLRRTTLSGSSVPRVALPRTQDHGELV